jgi:hypothetical protein
MKFWDVLICRLLSTFFADTCHAPDTQLFFNLRQIVFFPKKNQNESKKMNLPAANPTTFEFTGQRRSYTFLHQRKIIFILKTSHAIRCAVNFYNAGVVTQSRRIGSWSWITYNATCSLERFEKILLLWKRSSLLQRWRCCCKFQSRRIDSRFAWRRRQIGMTN